MGNVPAKESVDSSTGSRSMTTADFAKQFLIARLDTNSNEHTLVKHGKEKESKKWAFRAKQMNNLIVKYDENVDGGYLAPFDNYKYNLDYQTELVRELIKNRKLSPFFTPLQDYDENWTDEELLEYLKNNLTIHKRVDLNTLADGIEDPNEHKLHMSSSTKKKIESKLKTLKLKQQAGATQNYEIERHLRDFKEYQVIPEKFPNIFSDDLLLRIYKDCEECPICFLYYPKLLNSTRCCDQPICTECFVQMKRLDPHYPHDEGGTPGPANQEEENDPGKLISEPVKCPFCAVGDFGVLYSPPADFRVGLDSSCKPGEYNFNDPGVIEENEGEDSKDNENVVLTEADLADPFSTKRETLERRNKLTHSRNTSNITQHGSSIERARRGSVPKDGVGVITIDLIRPDWEQKLLSARAKIARRSAAATALHATSLLTEEENANGDTGGRRRHSHRSHARNGHTYEEQQLLEERLIQEAMRLSLLDEEERQMRERMRNSL